MILVDTSVWVDHLRTGDARLAALLNSGEVLAHPFVVGELALANLARREIVLASLCDLPPAVMATDIEARQFIEREALFGLGVGYIDVHLLAATRLTPNATLWTRDRRLRGVCERLGLAAMLT